MSPGDAWAQSMRPNVSTAFLTSRSVTSRHVHRDQDPLARCFDVVEGLAPLLIEHVGDPGSLVRKRHCAAPTYPGTSAGYQRRRG